MSPELEILRHPQRAFARSTAAPQRVTLIDACYRPAVVLVTIATAVSISATSHVSVALLASAMACWSLALALQVVAAWLVIPASARRRFGTARMLDLFFTAHAPWSLWLLGFALWAFLAPITGRDVRWPLASIVLPIAWTAIVVFAFFRAALAMSHRSALRRTFAHQALTLGIGFGVFALAVAIWPRLLGTFAR